MTKVDTKQESGKSSLALQPYGDRDEVKELGRRIMALHPAAHEIGEQGANLLAQLGVALGLNPLPGTGHIHAWFDKKTQSLCVHIGIEGRMALARNDAPFTYSTRPMNAAEHDYHEVRAGDRGAVTELYRLDLTKEMAAQHIPIKPIIGIGIARQGELIPKGRSLAWRAEQRSIKDAVRGAYSFKLPLEVMGMVNIVGDQQYAEHAGGDDLEGAVEGTFTEVPVSQAVHAESVDAGEVAPPTESSDAGQGQAQPQAKPKGGRAATIRTAKFNDVAWEVAAEFPHYADGVGTPNKYHIAAALYKEGMTEVTDSNVWAVLETIRKRVEREQAEKAAQPEGQAE